MERINWIYAAHEIMVILYEIRPTYIIC